MTIPGLLRKALVAGSALAWLLGAATASANGMEGCTVLVDGRAVSGPDVARVVSGTPVTVECLLPLREYAPHWLVLKTDGDAVAMNLQRLDAEGNVVEETTYESPEVIVRAGDYRILLAMHAPQVVEVLTRASGLRTEVARPQSKTLLTMEVRSAPNGTNILAPDLKDLTSRVAVIADMKATVVHPYYATAESALHQARAQVARLKADHGDGWEAANLLDRDLQRLEEAMASGQLDHVADMALVLQRYAVEESAMAERIASIDGGRAMALRVAIIAGAAAAAALALGGVVAYAFFRKTEPFDLDMEGLDATG